MRRLLIIPLVLLLAACEFYDGFDRDNGLVTNEYAHWNPDSPSAVHSPDWDMTSGSLFIENGFAYSGVPDGNSPGPTSSTYTGSSVFRLNTKRFDFGSVSVRFDLRIDALSSTSRTPAVAWDGIHVFMRYQSEEQLYYASVDRRDGTVVIKKKCAGGPTNGGTYYTLGSRSGFPIQFGAWENVGADIVDNTDGSVTLRLWRNGSMLLEVVDRGTGCAPLTGTGATGIRGDNAEFYFDGFIVEAI